MKKGLNLKPGDPNYDIKQLAVECATKRMYPDVLMYDKIVELTGSFKAPMGCRSFLQGWKDNEGNEVNSGRMNLGVVTMNLPRIALESNGDMDLFGKYSMNVIDVCHTALKFKVKRVLDAIPENAPILYQYGAFGKRLKPGEDVNELFKNERATVSLGYIGLYEVGTVFYGPNWEHNKEAHDFTLSIVKKLHDACAEWSAQSGYHYSVYSTPSESLTDRFCRLDTEKFGKIKDITDKEYYTNSFHYDVRKHPTPFEKLSFEMDYPKYMLQAGLFIIANTLICVKIRKLWKPFGIGLMRRSAILEPIRRSIIAISAVFKANSKRRSAALSVQRAAITIRRLAIASKELAAILESFAASDGARTSR